MYCNKCGAELPENAKFCINCGAEPITDTINAETNQAPNVETETEYISAAGAEGTVPKSFSSKKNIIIIIIAAIVLIIGGVTAVAIGTNGFDFSGVRTTLQLADRYLSEQNYEQAIIEFEKVLEIEPMNVDAYLGLAEAYMAFGKTDKAIRILEDGIEKTDSYRLKDKLEEIRESEKHVTTKAEVTVAASDPAESTDVTTMAATTEAEPNVEETTAETVVVETEPEPVEVTTAAKPEPAATAAETKPVVTTTTTTTAKPEPVVTKPPVEEGTVTILGEEYDIKTTTVLHLNNKGITDKTLKDIIPEIKKLTNLKLLSMTYNQITDTTPLTQLTDMPNLTQLFLSENQITDISSLAKLTNLTYLSLDFNQVSDITPLGKLTKMTWLNLDNNQIKDMSPLAKLTELTYLGLNDNQVTDITASAKFTKATMLYFNNNKITNITPLTKLTNLTHLFLEGNPISKQDIESLRSKLPNCEIYFK